MEAFHVKSNYNDGFSSKPCLKPSTEDRTGQTLGSFLGEFHLTPCLKGMGFMSLSEYGVQYPKITWFIILFGSFFFTLRNIRISSIFRHNHILIISVYNLHKHTVISEWIKNSHYSQLQYAGIQSIWRHGLGPLWRWLGRTCTPAP
jgi:hypothetical protein